MPDDIEVHQPGSEPVRGLAAYVAMMEGMCAGLEEFRIDLDDQFATDDRVVCRWRTSGTHTGDFFGMPPTGKRIEFPGANIWELDHGKARRGWAFPDIASLMAQLMAT